ncbi:MAG TPA: VWA domain-containing protein [Candidatus Nanopelagicaceae bacterium]|nr:VWA domain-containing protein [Candidatus Nanopelagicaceae bacterium]
MSERHPENIVVCIDSSRSMYRADYTPNRFVCSINAMKKLISERFAQDASSAFAIVNFSNKPKKIMDFTNDTKMLFEVLDDLEVSGKSALGEALGLSIKLIISELRKISAKVPRILVISDGNFTTTSIDPLKMARLAQGLNVKIDTFRLGELSPLNILKRMSDLTGGNYYYNNDAQSLLQAAHDLAGSNIKTYGDGKTSIIENPAFLRKIAADLLRVHDLTKDQEQRLLQIRGLADYKKCSICFSDVNPYTNSSFYVSGRYCPHCQTPYHIHCLSSWANSQKDRKMIQAGTVRCPHCFYLLKIPTEVSQVQKLTSLSKPRIKAKKEPKTPELSHVELVKFSDLDSDDMFKSCPVCNFIFEEGQDLLRCDNCKSLFHEIHFNDLTESRCKNCGVKLHKF